MPGYEKLAMLSINYDTVKADNNTGELNKQYKQDKSKTNKNVEINLPVDGKNNHKINYFLAKPENRNVNVGRCQKKQNYCCRKAQHIQ